MIRAAAVVALLLMAVSGADAATSISPGIAVRAGYDTNPTMQDDQKLGSAAVTGEVDLPASWRGPRGGMDFRATLRSTNYENNALRDAVNHVIDARADYAFRRSTIFAAVQTSLVNATLTEADDTGVFTNDVDRAGSLYTIGLNHALGSRLSVRASASRQDVEFRGDEFNRFIDYTYEGVSLGASFLLGEQSALTGRVEQYQLDFPEILSTTDTRAYNLGFVHRLSRRWDIAAEAGLAENDTSRTVFFFIFPISIEESSTARLADIRVTRSGDNASLSLFAGASLRPSGNGQLQRQLNAGVSWKTDLGPRATLALSAEAKRFELPDNSLDETIRDFRVISASMQTRMSNRVSVGLDVRYRQNINDFAAGRERVEAEGAAVFVRFSMRLGGTA